VSTGITASITPLFSTSKILVSITYRDYINGPTATINAVYRSTTNLVGGQCVYSNSPNISAISTLQYLDSPATTSSTTYTLYHATQNGSYAAIIAPSGSNNDFPAIVTLMEIAA
jgi:hypothetical protein